MARMEFGKYISFSQLKPGETGDIQFIPLNTEVQAETEVNIIFLAEHPLTENGVFLITFPPLMILPEVGSTVEVRG